MNETVINSSAFPFSEADLKISIPERFERVAALLTEQPAVISGNRQLTYGQLNCTANRVAQMILARFSVRRAPIALLVANDLAIFSAILGVLKSGKAYCALNPGFPESRNQFIVDDLESDLILTDTANLGKAQRLATGGRSVVNIDKLDASYSESNPQCDLRANMMSVIFYTSGTTGTPKGVVRDHANLMHRGLIAEQVCPSHPDDVTSMLYPCSSAASVSDMYVSLLTGGTLALYDMENFSPQGLASWLTNSKITRLHLHTSVLRQLLDSLTLDDFFSNLRFIRPSDRLYYGDVKRLWKRVSSETVIVHGLSSSETGSITLFTLDNKDVDDDEIVPVGYPVPCAAVFVVDEFGAPLKTGEIGEIVASGPSISKGYWRRPELTAERFWDDPSDESIRTCKVGDFGLIRLDGCLELVGRKDHMVKIRGHRVELGEIEMALERMDAIQRAVVVVYSDNAGDQALAAYVQAIQKEQASPGILRQRLGQDLPTPMIPTRFFILDDLPLLPNGKVDRRSLPPPSQPILDSSYDPPRTPLESDLAAIWADVLGYDRVGINDNFLDLGGQSLQAARIINRVLSTWQIELPLRVLFESPTVADMALSIIQQQAAKLDEDTLNRLLAKLDD